jgi:phytoene dehydrogenase-like protein
MKIVIIGSGMAGLTAAAYLVRDGHQVTVYEQFAEIGGVTATLRREGFGWDIGPLLLEDLGSGEPAGEVLAELGIAEQVRLAQEDRGVAFPRLPTLEAGGVRRALLAAGAAEGALSPRAGWTGPLLSVL